MTVLKKVEKSKLAVSLPRPVFIRDHFVVKSESLLIAAKTQEMV